MNDKDDVARGAAISPAGREVVLHGEDGSGAQKSFWAGYEAAKAGPAQWNIRAAWNEFKASESFARLNPAPAEQQSAAVVPEGYVLVPVEPTPAMINAAACAITTPDDLPPVSDGWNMSDLAFRSRYLAALSAAPAPVQQASPWIPISERLPEPFTVVALLDENRWMNTGCDDFEANWTGAGWLWANGINDNGMYWCAIGERHGLNLDSVTHWMSLPAAPTQGGDKS